jgi:hypothetical protein
VQEVREADRDGVDVLPREQRAGVLVDVGRAVPVGEGMRALGVGVRDGDNAHAFACKGAHADSVTRRDPAAADDPVAELFTG